MTRLYVRQSECRTSLSWQEKYPTSYVYSSPAEIDDLKKILKDEQLKRQAAQAQPPTLKANG